MICSPIDSFLVHLCLSSQEHTLSYRCHPNPFLHSTVYILLQNAHFPDLKHATTLLVIVRFARHGATMSKEEDLDGERQTGVQNNHDDKQDLADLAIGGAEHGVQVAQQEGNRHAEADGDKDPVEDGDGRRADEGDGDPDEVGVAVEGPALEEVGRLAAKVAEGEEETHGDEEGVAVDKTGSAWTIMLASKIQGGLLGNSNIPLSSLKS